MKRILFLNLALIVVSFSAYCQPIGLTIPEAEKRGIKMLELDSLYKSALHYDSSKAVFKSEPEQKALQNAYEKLLQDFGKFLAENHFQWEKPSKCFNRIYFAPNGTIDYFLYRFMTKGVKAEDLLSQEKHAEFDRLLNQFIQKYSIGIAAKTRFAQCSPTVYLSEVGRK